MKHISLMDMLPDDEAMLPVQKERALTRECMGLVKSRCAQCEQVFEYFARYHQYKIQPAGGGKRMVFCSYGCMRAKKREIAARESARREARARKSVARCEAKMRDPGWKKLTRREQESVRQTLERAKAVLEDTTAKGEGERTQ